MLCPNIVNSSALTRVLLNSGLSFGLFRVCCSLDKKKPKNQKADQKDSALAFFEQAVYTIFKFANRILVPVISNILQRHTCHAVLHQVRPDWKMWSCIKSLHSKVGWCEK